MRKILSLVLVVLAVNSFGKNKIVQVSVNTISKKKFKL